MISSIHTERLELIPMTPEFLRASIRGNLRLAEDLLALLLPEDWPQSASLLQLRLDQLEVNPDLQPWLLRAITLRDTRTMIGNIGFHTGPAPDYLRPWSPNAVEFGFTVFPPYRRRGYAREASLAMMHWATAFHGISTFVLSIRPGNTASQALAAGLGFVRIGSHIDEVDGLEDVLILEVPAREPGGHSDNRPLSLH